MGTSSSSCGRQTQVTQYLPIIARKARGNMRASKNHPGEQEFEGSGLQDPRGKRNREVSLALHTTFPFF